jgi:hypothetical protein
MFGHLSPGENEFGSMLLITPIEQIARKHKSKMTNQSFTQGMTEQIVLPSSGRAQIRPTIACRRIPRLPNEFRPDIVRPSLSILHRHCRITKCPFSDLHPNPTRLDK